jgi:hypothetical protein
MDKASVEVKYLAGKHKTFALLWARAKTAISSFQQRAALIPACLFAVIQTPLAEPQIKMPNAESPFSTLSATK